MDFYTVLALALVASPLDIHAASHYVLNSACQKMDDCFGPINEKYETFRFLMPKASEIDEMCATVRPELEQCLQGVDIDDCDIVTTLYEADLTNLVLDIVCSLSRVRIPDLKSSFCATDEISRIEFSRSVSIGCQNIICPIKIDRQSSVYGTFDEFHNRMTQEILQCLEKASTEPCGFYYGTFYNEILSKRKSFHDSWKMYRIACQIMRDISSAASIISTKPYLDMKGSWPDQSKSKLPKLGYLPRYISA